MSDGKPNPDVFAIGDAAIIKDNPLPATAQGTVSILVYAAMSSQPILLYSCQPESALYHEEIKQDHS